MRRECGRKDLSEKVAKNVERLEVGEVGNVERVITVHDIKQTIALRPREGEEVHGVVVHAKQGREMLCFGRIDEVTV